MAEAEEGRSCPLAYRYDPGSLCRNHDEVAEDVLYIVGGLYGNLFAYEEVARMALAEERHGKRVRLVFNGDFNWFNADDEWFRAVNRRVLKHTATLGNVEYELANPGDGAGCGCAYPGFVDQVVVERSNRIMERMQAVAVRHPDLRAQLSGLPRYRCLIFGGLKILVLHGDPEALAGWGLSRETLTEEGVGRLKEWFRQTGADAILCTHTCLPVLWSGEVDGRIRLLANNGSAGMGNLAGDPRGLITRVAPSPAGTGVVAGIAGAGLYLDLLPVAFDLSSWLAAFDRLWLAGSPAALSYRQRILEGTRLQPEQLILHHSP
ncbi:MAG: hypothetical protein SVX28_02190 [Pseudomonadota bacterium]|nr:hypothetical protein [Pseudomonadota bacterium]